jgi:hypothetical protein
MSGIFKSSCTVWFETYHGAPDLDTHRRKNNKPHPLVLKMWHPSRALGILIWGLAWWPSIPRLHSVKTDLGVQTASYDLSTGGLFPRRKVQGRETDHPHPSRAEVMNGGAIPLLSHTSSWPDAKLIEPRINFILHLLTPVLPDKWFGSTSIITRLLLSKHCLIINHSVIRWYCHVYEWLQTGFELVILFIEQLQIVTTSKCSPIANSHPEQFTKAHTNYTQFTVTSVVVWQRLPTADVPLTLDSRNIPCLSYQFLTANSLKDWTAAVL